MQFFKYLLILLGIIHTSVAPPTTKNKEPAKTQEKEESEEKNDKMAEMNVEYSRYLNEVVEALETDPEFRKKLETAQEADFRNGKVAAELEYVNHHVRTKLDELKRTELNRLRELVRKVHENEIQDVPASIMHPPEHLDHTNPHSFEVADLHKLINKVAYDLQEADRKRKEEFKEYELQKEFEKKQKLMTLSDKEKEEYLKELEEQRKKHAKHAPIHHPGSKAQLEEVWEKQDHMTQQEFNPKTFFYLHDLDGNGYWDVDETKALFKKELDKMYQAGVPEDDMKEREEEMERMREHVFNETDTNKDMLITLEEFIEHTRKQEFYRDDGWETVDQQPVYTPEEYRAFEEKRQQEIQKMIKQGLLPPQPHGMHHQGGHHIPQHYPQHIPPHGMPQGYDQGMHHPNQGMGQMQHPHSNQMAQGMGHPNQIPQGMGHPNQINQGMGHPNQMNQGMGHPNQMNQGMGHHNQMNQGMGHPNQMNQGMGHPNQMNQGMGHPNQMNQGMGHPNQMNQGMGHPNQMNQGMGHPNQMNQGMGHPNQMNQGMGHPNQMDQDMGHPNQQMSEGMGHPNQMAQGMGHPNQLQGQKAPQDMGHPNQISQQNQMGSMKQPHPPLDMGHPGQQSAGDSIQRGQNAQNFGSPQQQADTAQAQAAQHYQQINQAQSHPNPVKPSSSEVPDNHGLHLKQPMQ